MRKFLDTTDPPKTISAVVAWEHSRTAVEGAVGTRPEGKTSADRKPADAILRFKVFALQSVYNLSEEQREFLIRDWLKAHGLP